MITLTNVSAHARADVCHLRGMSTSSAKWPNRDGHGTHYALQRAVLRPPEDGTAVESVSHLRDPG